MIPIAKPLIGEEEKNAVLAVLHSGALAQGQKVKEFEEQFARYVGVEHAIATSSGTTALHTALLAHDIGPENEVITTPFTFAATANSILFTGAKPVFADIYENTFNVDVEKVTEKITKKTKAIMVVSLFGLMPEMKAFLDLAEDHNLLLIEDACQSHGAEYNGRKSGSFTTSCFSFYPTKNMTTGEGGIITTNSKEIVEKSRMIISHGSKIRYVHDRLGFNFRMTNIAAAIGIEQLKKLDYFNHKRIENATYLQKRLAHLPLQLPQVNKNYKHVFHQFSVLVEKRDEVLKKLKEKEIMAEIYYPTPLYNQPFYKQLGYNSQGFAVSDKVAQHILSLPIHPSVTKQELDYIAEALEEIL